MPREPLEAILLVGGKGTRLRPLTLSAPKPLLPTAGVPFLAHQLARAAECGITHVVLATSYRAEMFAEAFGDWGFRREAFFPCYGLAEATLFVSGGPLGEGPRRCCVEPSALEEAGQIVAAAIDNSQMVMQHRKTAVNGFRFLQFIECKIVFAMCQSCLGN